MGIKNIILLGTLLLIWALRADAATYYSQGSLDPSDKSNWNTARTNGNGSGKAHNFTTSGDIFVIQNGHSMSTTSAWSITGTGAELQIENGGSLTLSSFTVYSTLTFTIARTGSFTINNGATGDDLTVSGVLSNAGTMTYGTGATGNVQSTGTYEHNQNGGNIPAFTWNSGSTCKITGVQDTRPGNIAQTYHHFTWNCASQTTNVVLAGGFTTSITGDFTVSSTGSAALVRANGSSTALSITGNLLISSGATFDLTSGTGSPTIDLSGNLTVNGTLTRSGTGTGTINFAKSGTQTFSNTGTISNAVNFAVNSGSTVDPGTSVFTGTGSFTLNSGAGLIIYDVNGITSSAASGQVQVSGTRSFSTGANYTYSGSASQVFGNGLPATINNLTINNGNTGMTLNGSLTVSGTLSLSSGKLSIGGNTLSLNGNFSGSSANSLQGNGSNSALSIGGSGSIGTLYFDQSTPGTTNCLSNLTFNRSSQTITLGNTLQVKGTVTPTAGTLASAGNLVLVSNASGTARVAAIGASADITGSVKVQRYIPAVARRWRVLSASTVSFTLTDLIDNIFVTGTGGSASGFDANNNTASVYTYQETTTGTRGWKATANINTSVPAGKGMFVFIRGDRTLPSPDWYTQNYTAYPNTGGYPAQNAVTIDFNGTLNKGTITPSISYTNTGDASNDGWNLVGNPYASPIDWTALSKSNLASFYYVLDPSTGSYVANSGTQFIASGQAFFVHATGASPSLSFTESCKTASAPTSYFKTAPQVITVKMVKDSMSSDAAFLEFRQGTSRGFDGQEDAIKYTNSGINMGWLLDSTKTPAQYSAVPEPAGADTFAMFVNASQGSYTLRFSDLQHLPEGYAAYLIDQFTGITTDIKANPVYSFAINANSASYGNGRFQLVLSPVASLPVSLLSFTARRSEENVVLEWKTASEKNNDHFTVERAADNHSFEPIGQLNGAGNSVVVRSYSLTDTHAPAGNLYYRLKQVDKDGSTSYSETLVIRDAAERADMQLSVFPNPASHFLNIRTADMYSAATITDLNGSIVWKQNIVPGSGTVTLPVEQLQNGSYFITLQGAATSAGKTIRFVKSDPKN